MRASRDGNFHGNFHGIFLLLDARIEGRDTRAFPNTNILMEVDWIVLIIIIVTQTNVVG